MKDPSTTKHAKKQLKKKEKGGAKLKKEVLAVKAKSLGDFKKKSPTQQTQKQWRSKSDGGATIPAPQKKPKKESYAQVKERKMQLVSELKSNWNSARPKASEDEDRATLIAAMMGRIKGQVHQVSEEKTSTVVINSFIHPFIHQVALRHDTSRVVQTILQFGTYLPTYIHTHITS